MRVTKKNFISHLTKTIHAISTFPRSWKLVPVVFEETCDFVLQNKSK